MKFSQVLEKINAEIDKNEEQEVKESTPIKKIAVDHKALAEKALIVKHLKEKKKLTEQEEKFVTDVESIELSDEDRTKVKESIDTLMKEACSKKKKKMKKEDEDDEKTA